MLAGSNLYDHEGESISLECTRKTMYSSLAGQYKLNKILIYCQPEYSNCGLAPTQHLEIMQYV